MRTNTINEDSARRAIAAAGIAAGMSEQQAAQCFKQIVYLIQNPQANSLRTRLQQPANERR